eukprot:15096919-Ditylum_brightwellii.AAC.1
MGRHRCSLCLGKDGIPVNACYCHGKFFDSSVEFLAEGLGYIQANMATKGALLQCSNEMPVPGIAIVRRDVAGCFECIQIKADLS